MTSQTRRLAQRYTRAAASNVAVLTEDDFEELSPDVAKSWKGYEYKMSYTVTSDDSEGESVDQGWEEEGSSAYNSLEELLKTRDIKNNSWLEWSDSRPSPRSWLISDSETDPRTNDTKTYSLWIQRVDGKPLSPLELRFIAGELRL